jgi:hypothetical protein
MPQTAKAKLSEIDLLGNAPIRWKQTIGVRPSTTELDVRPNDADRLVEQQGPLRLVVDHSSGNLVVEDLYVVHRTPGENPELARVLVADRRVWWSYGHIKRSYNWRRVTGPKRVELPDQPPELDPLLDSVAYKPFSTRTDQGTYEDRWRADEILDAVLEEIGKVESGFSAAPNILVDPNLRKVLAAYPVEDLDLDDTLDNALLRLLGILPEAAVTIDLDGSIRVFSRASGAENQVVRNLGPEIVDEGHVELVAPANVRPREVHVLFTREVELRFDFEELASRSSSASEETSSLKMANVLAIPDYSLDVAGKTLPLGSWITFAEALTAWGDTGIPAIGTLDFVDLQRAFVPFLDLWAGLDLLGKTVPDADWSSRIAAMQQHYRQTFRIPEEWLERIVSLRAHRVGTIDPTTGSRAPASVYADYAYLATQRALFYQLSMTSPLPYASNVKGFPPSGDIDSTTKAAPAKVVVLDEDQGIIRFDFLVDPLRLYEMVLPSMVEIEGSGTDAGGYPTLPGPGGAIRLADSVVTFDSVSELHREAVPKLTSGYQAAVILTAIPGSPNDDRQLQRIVRKPEDVAGFLPGNLGSRIGGARGPVMEVRIGPGVETARVAWNDDLEDEFKKLFGFGGEPNLAKIEEQTVNLASSALGASLDRIADAVAARVYAGFADHLEGDAAGDMNAAVRTEGWVVEVSHELATGGESHTRISLPEKLPALNLLSLLDSGARAVILRTARPGKAN